MISKILLSPTVYVSLCLHQFWELLANFLIFISLKGKKILAHCFLLNGKHFLAVQENTG